MYQFYRTVLNVEVITEITELIFTKLKSFSSINTIGQRTLTWTVQPAYWKKEQKLQLTFPLAWKSAPSGINSYLIFSFINNSLPATTCKSSVSQRFKHFHDILVPYCLQEIWAICRRHSCCFPSPPPLLQASCYSTRISALKCILKINAPKDIEITSPNAANGKTRSHCHLNCKDEELQEHSQLSAEA